MLKKYTRDSEAMVFILGEMLPIYLQLRQNILRNPQLQIYLKFESIKFIRFYLREQIYRENTHPDILKVNRNLNSFNTSVE